MKFCPYCRSTKPLVKAGILRSYGGYAKQRYECKSCRRVTVKPLSSK